MKQIVDKLNKIAKKIDESVEIPQTDLIIDSLDAITKAYGGTPNDSNLIVDKLEDIYNNIGSAPSGNIEITENTAEGEPLNIAQYATATVNVAGGGLEITNKKLSINFIDSTFDTNNIVCPMVSLIDNQLIGGLPSLTNESKLVELYVIPSTDPQPWIYTTTGFTTFNYSDLVNCTVREEDGSYRIFITDTTQDASLTLSAVASIQ